MLKTTFNRRSGIASSWADDGVKHVVMARLSNSVQASRNTRVRLAQRIGTVCRPVIISYLDDERLTMSAAFAHGVPEDGFLKRHDNARRLTDELDQLDPTQDAGLGLLGRIANVLQEYVGWEEHVLYPSIEQMLQDKDKQKSSESAPSIAADASLPPLGA